MVGPLGNNEDWLRKKGKGEVRGKEHEGLDVGSTTEGKVRERMEQMKDGR